MHLQGAHEDGTTAAAEQLVAEEAREAAKAAAKKAKKQKAKARKQQACLDAVASSQPTSSQSSHPQSLALQVSAGSSLQTQPKASLLKSTPSERRSEDLSPDQAPDSSQPDSQHRAVHETAVNIRPAHTALHEQVSTSDRPAGGMPAASPAAVEASPGADARFLDQLFCCPITKVLPPCPFSLYQLLHLIQLSLPMLGEHPPELRTCVRWGESVRTSCGSFNLTPVMHVLIWLSSYATTAVCIWQDCCLLHEGINVCNCKAHTRMPLLTGTALSKALQCYTIAKRSMSEQFQDHCCIISLQHAVDATPIPQPFAGGDDGSHDCS